MARWNWAPFIGSDGRVFGGARALREITQRDMDLAFAMQHVFEEVFFDCSTRDRQFPARTS